MDIRIDADFVLAEVTEAGDIHGLTDKQIEVIEAFDEDVIMQAMNNNLNDEFWDALDTMRQHTISDLARKANEEIEGQTP